MSVDTESFSAHADYKATEEYISVLQPPNIILVHGDQNEMKNLKNSLNEKYAALMQILTPRNCQMVKFNLVSKKSAKIIGNLAKKVISQTAELKERLVAEL